MFTTLALHLYCMGILSISHVVLHTVTSMVYYVCMCYYKTIIAGVQYLADLCETTQHMKYIIEYNCIFNSRD